MVYRKKKKKRTVSRDQTKDAIESQVKQQQKGVG
jgi:hypothetical protein